ncbi:DUF3027 domain-containing protein [Nocardia sp. NPDC127579]|uniref:DUF3027 domain-containing protein n=1 Tax=Nocardia sp. NPDC127579 TaxID=3345402 RepID=UPI0036352486
MDVARRALLELEPSAVGGHLGVSFEDESAATHRFEATLPGYRGWQWAVVVAAPPGAEYATVSESALLPGPDALVAPEFVPWEQRVRPGDLAPGDLLAPPPNDPRLVPGYVATGDPVVDEVAFEVGLGRSKVLSLEGRAEAADRWYAEFGPDTDMAKAAPATCGLCGFYLPLAGAMRAAFGVCANTMGADGRVVHTEYGCGAHSDVEPPTGQGSPLYEAYDDAAFDVIPPEELRKPEPETAPESETAAPEASLSSEAGDTTLAAPTAASGATDSSTAPEPHVEAIATTATEHTAPGIEAVASEPSSETTPEPRQSQTDTADTAVAAPLPDTSAADSAGESEADASMISTSTEATEHRAESAGHGTESGAAEGGSENGVGPADAGGVVSVRPKGELAVPEGAAEPEADDAVTFVADGQGEVVVEESGSSRS